MIPLTPISPYIRKPSFVAAEWAAKLAGFIDSVDSGWKGILMANLAIADPQAAWNFFTTNFRSSWLDDGASLTWYLAFTAGLLAGGQPPQPIPQPPHPNPHPPQPQPQPPPPVAQPWDTSKVYSLGAIVSYQGHTYQCTIAHHAQADWSPAAAPSLWKQIS